MAKLYIHLLNELLTKCFRIDILEKQLNELPVTLHSLFSSFFLIICIIYIYIIPVIRAVVFEDC